MFRANLSDADVESEEYRKASKAYIEKVNLAVQYPWGADGEAWNSLYLLGLARAERDDTVDVDRVEFDRRPRDRFEYASAITEPILRRDNGSVNSRLPAATGDTRPTG